MEKNTNKKKKRKIFLAILMIVFTGVVLTASTYAWFTANKTVTVENVDVNVAASNGLQISTDAINWKTIISNDDIKAGYAGSTNQLPASTNSIVPVSSAGTIDSTTGFMNMYAGSIDSNDSGNYILTADKSTEEAGTAGKFVAFDLFFQVNEETPIYLTSASGVVTSDGKTSTGIENAARLAFIDEGNSAAGTAAATIQGLKAGTKALIWEPNYDVHTAAAVKNASDNYGVTTSLTGAERISYYGVDADISKESDTALKATTTGLLKSVTPDITTPIAGIAADAYQSFVTLKAGITKVRVYMWVEGQDVDCENNASGGSITFNLQFSSLDAA